jgi:hypothetical protein
MIRRPLMPTLAVALMVVLKDLRWLGLVSMVSTRTDSVERDGFPDSSHRCITETAYRACASTAAAED